MAQTEPHSDSGPGTEDGSVRERSPQGPVETLVANFRPQPAIPAAFVFVFAVLLPAIMHGPAAPADVSWWLWLVPPGIVVSCALAIAAGFCSLFPQTVWVLAAVWAMQLIEKGRLPAYNRYLLVAGIVVAVAMFVVQLWRVRTGRFVPTIRIVPDEEDPTKPPAGR